LNPENGIRLDLQGINLSSAKLAGSKLWNVSLTKGDLRKADLRKAILYSTANDTILENADLQSADLRGARLPSVPSCYAGVKMENAVYDGDTECGSIDISQFGAIFDPSGMPTTSNEPMAIFISYAWANKEVILAVDQWLRNKGLSTKIDDRDFFAGKRIMEEIARVMATCGIVLIFYSAESKDKAWPDFERELAADLEMEARQREDAPPRVIYVVIDGTSLPDTSTRNRLAIMAKDKEFETVCGEIYNAILMIPKAAPQIDLSKFKGYVFGRGSAK